MANFPITIDNYLTNFKSRSIKPANRQTSAAGYTMSFTNATVTKKAFDFTLNWLSNTQKETLQTFFDTNQGISFTIDFTCTGDTTTYTVVFDQDELNFNYIRSTADTFSVDFKVKEV